MSRPLHRWFILIVLLLLASPLLADNLIMIRTPLQFDDAEKRLKDAVAEYGYTVLEVNPINLSLVAADFSAEQYRAISLESSVGTAELLDRHPMLASFLPLRIILFAEHETSVLVTLNPLYLKNYFTDEELAGFFWQWNRDLHQILLTVQQAEP